MMIASGFMSDVCCRCLRMEREYIYSVVLMREAGQPDADAAPKISFQAGDGNAGIRELHDDIGELDCLGVALAGQRRLAEDGIEFIRGGLGLGGIPRTDKDPMAGIGPAQRDAAAFSAGAANRRNCSGL